MPQQESYKALQDLKSEDLKKVKDFCTEDSAKTLKKLQKDLDDARLKSNH